ncbi:sensor histidine kinase [Paenibacillus aceris]|uniref:histidine kinase n=1 Tax=Paenibacillus aceris TaxID=869555 RepID=A0ABS4I480_9BACL|nr:sensor histidine kinase [Paenibacillus aceris]MBP1965540.1 two-component system sensor histidine kinase YesM [Paenibacillus aceris]NHW33411.1 histidine kinase [Paenibacillus aceris]
MRIKQYLHRLSLRQKLILTSIACLVIPTLLMLYTTIIYSERIIRDQTQEKAIQSLKIVQTQIYTIVDEMVSISNFIQFDTELRALMENGKTDPLAAKQITTRLEQIAGEKPDLQLTLLMADGRAYSDYSFYDWNPLLFTKRTWFSQLSQLSAYDTLFIGAEPNYISGKEKDMPYVVLTARMLYSDSPKPLASLIVSRAENAVRDLFADFTENVYLLDANNRILSNRNPELIGSNFQHVLDLSHMPPSGMIELNGTNQLITSIPLRFAGWKLVSVAPYEQLTKKLTAMYHSNLILQMLFAAVFLIALVFFLRKFTKPIQILGHVVKKVEEGDITIRSNIRGADEVGQFGRSFDNMLDRILEMLEHVKLEQELKRHAELALLQAQIHPHFLFNVLSSIRLKLLMKDDKENAELVESLSSLLRAMLSSSQQEFIPLHAELGTVKQYMDLMNFAIRHPIEANIDVAPELQLEEVPRFILQPLIENAYKHGFIRRKGHVLIQARKTETTLLITVKDDGKGLDELPLKQLQERLQLNKQQIVIQSRKSGYVPPSGIGLSNVYERLKLIYGDLFEMKISSEPRQGLTIELHIPTDFRKGEPHV